MKANHINYEFLKSFARIEQILSEKDNSYEELESIPNRDALTYTNGFYVKCTALFVDIRDSSKLTEKHRRPTLAKLYRAFVSEVVAVMNGNNSCAEIKITGDCVNGIFNTPSKPDFNAVFATAARISSLIQMLNYKLNEYNITPIRIGMGMDYGRALMIKAGYLGSSINDVVWMGDVLNYASNLCNNANRNITKSFMVSKVIYINLNADNQNLLNYNSYQDCYEGNIVNVAMENWYNTNLIGNKNHYGHLRTDLFSLLNYVNK